jgi:asparagine synthase (glutamine-hydrolysing)
MISDVPLGAFLSGGIDSSLVVSLMQSQSPKPIKTFTIGFNEKDYNEAPHALAVARHLGTEHTELYVSPTDAMDVIPKLPTMYDEPFADISQIPTFLVAQLARQHVTVALSGDGGDEVFAGYNRYIMGDKIWQKCQRLPARKIIGKILSHTPHPVWKALEKLLPARYKALRPSDRIAQITQILSSKTAEDLYLTLVSQWLEPESLLKVGLEPKLDAYKETAFLNETIEKMQYIDTLTYLPDDVLTKVDRATMYASLEARVPLLDHRVVAMGWRYSALEKIQGPNGKLPLREILKDYVPNELFDRPKMGFGVPVHDWLRDPLREWADDLLNSSDFPTMVDPKPIRKVWREHLEGKANHQNALWTILMLQAWHKQWKD